MRPLVLPFCQLGPPRSIPAPPTPFSSLSCWHEVNIPGWVSQTCAPPHYPAPWGTQPSPTQHKIPATAPGTHKLTRKSPLRTTHTSRGTSRAPTHPHPRRRAELGKETDPPTPGPAAPRGDPQQLTWKPAQLPPTSLLRMANRTAGVGPPAGHSSASAALAESRGPNVRRGRTGRWLFWGVGIRLFGEDGLSEGRGGPDVVLLGGERVSGNEVSCCIKNRGGQR